MSTWLAIGIPIFFIAGAGLGYAFGRLDQKGWLSDMYQIACWQRDEAILQRDKAIAQRDALQFQIEQLHSEVTRIWNSPAS